MFYVDEIIQLAKPPNDTGQTLEEYKSTVTHAGELTVQERTARHALKEPRVRVADTQATVRSPFQSELPSRRFCLQSALRMGTWPPFWESAALAV